MSQISTAVLFNRECFNSVPVCLSVHTHQSRFDFLLNGSFEKRRETKQCSKYWEKNEVINVISNDWY